MMTTIYTGECPKCRSEQTREWRGEPWVGYDGEDSFAADCHECGPGHELTMFPEEPEGDLRSRIDGYCVRSVSDDDGEFEIVVAFDGVESHLAIGDADRDEAVEVALCGLRLDYVRREVGRGTATAADVRVAIEDAAVLGHGDDDVSDLIEAFLLLASSDELDDWREEKVRRLQEQFDAGEDVEVFSLHPGQTGLKMVVYSGRAAS